ncbi:MULTISPECIES: PapB family radical SAM/SPASM ranthipeptide maturase [Paenibacillus]|uniref:PapB family radical SAM/SPASM ranthipeptide maturase n=1 Tax=Paenibacillus TaxID=44249 RepID=UPI0022B8F7FB|nr:SPASM domain-containing protein [Paenibacillus caseinilyticus]MCZ8521076.1 SPASM domain-containing protein [Paenibacillus caseinilyticus]
MQNATLEFYPNRIFRNSGKVYYYNILTNGLFEIDDDTLSFIKAAGKKPLEDVYAEMSDKWTGEFMDTLIQDMKDSMVIKTPENSNNIKAIRNNKPQPSHAVSSLILFMVQECNLRCTYCYAGDGEYNDKGRMSIDVAKGAVDYLIRTSGERKDLYLIFFGGEPLLNYNLVKETVLYAEQQGQIHNKRFSFSMTSNGTLITSEIEQFIIEHKIGVQISIDGDKETHDHNRFYKGRVGSYDKIIEKTEGLRKKRLLSARATVTNKQLNLSHTFEHLTQLGFRNIAMSPAAAMLTNDDYKTLIKENLKLIKEFENLINEGNFEKAVKMKNVLGYLQKVNGGQTSTYFCGAATNMLAVDIHGSLYPCHRFVSEKNYSLGDIYRGTSIKYDNFLDEVHVESRSTCTSCWARNLCTGGCHHENYVANGTTQTPAENYCKLTRAVFQEIIYLYMRLTEEQKNKLFRSKKKEELQPTS